MITISTFVFSGFVVNTYVLSDASCEALIVDAACVDSREENQLAGYLENHHLKPVRNINTHCHIDHILGNAYIEKKYGILPEYHQAGVPFFFTAREIAASFGYRLNHFPEAVNYLRDGQLIRWGQSELTVLYTPGHAEGSVCLYNKEQGFVLTGDVIFRNTVGRTDLPSGDLDALMRSIKEKLFMLPDDTVVYPGHGPQSTIGYEKRNNPFIR